MVLLAESEDDIDIDDERQAEETETKVQRRLPPDFNKAASASDPRQVPAQRGKRGVEPNTLAQMASSKMVPRELKSVLALMCKMMLQTKQEVRDVTSVIFEVFLVPVVLATAELALQQNALFDQKIRKRGKGHGLGLPHLITFGGLVAGVTKDLQALTDKSAEIEELKLFDKKWHRLNQEEQFEKVKFCRLAKTFDQGTRRLILAFGVDADSQKCKLGIMNALAAIPKVEHKIGRAPPGYMERELSNWVRTLGEA